MSILGGLLNDARELKQTLQDALDLQQLILERMQIMSQGADQLKTLMAGIKADVIEAADDMDELFAKINDLQGGATAAEMAELFNLASDLKTSTRALADKVPEPPTT
jgi:methyl-accepting chemotaxis protein